MSKSTFTILKQCENCGNMFEAQKRTTRFCSHRCNSQHYKLRQKVEIKKSIEKETFKTIRLKPKVKALDMELIKSKEFLTVSEIALLFNCSTKTVYRMINSKMINGRNLSERLTRIRSKDIEAIFEADAILKPKLLKIEDCYQMNEINDKFNIAANTIYNYVRKYNIQTLKQHGITYYSKADIDNLFQVF